MKKILINISITIVSTVMLYACGGSGDSSSSVEPIPLTVSSTTPLVAATGVVRNTDVTATFDEDIFGATVDGTSFTLAGNSSTSGTVSFDEAANVTTFTPDSDLALLTYYTATLTTSITDLSGNGLASDYSWSFTTDDGTWGTEELIDADNVAGHDAEYPQIAFDSSGNAIAVWKQTDGTVWSIWANRYVAGTGWGTAELLEADNVAGHHASFPQIAVDSSGNAIAVWYQTDGTALSIWANRYVAGTGWGAAELLEVDSGSNHHAYYPQIAFDSSGNAIAVWHQYDGKALSIWANRYVAGTGWGTAELIEADSVANHHARYPQIAFDSSGNAIAVWVQTDGTVDSIWANRYVAGTGWGTEELLEVDNIAGHRANKPQIAFDSSGNAIAVWVQNDGTALSMWANRYVAGTGWGTEELLEGDNVAGHDAYYPQIAFDSSGNAIAVWIQTDGTVWSVWANHYVAGTGWGTEELLEADNVAGHHVDEPQIAFDSSGNSIAVWYQYDGTVWSIWANRYVAGTGWGMEELIEADNVAGHDAYNPQIAIDSSGNAIAVWYQTDGTVRSIWANRFD